MRTTLLLLLVASILSAPTAPHNISPPPLKYDHPLDARAELFPATPVRAAGEIDLADRAFCNRCSVLVELDRGAVETRDFRGEHESVRFARRDGDAERAKFCDESRTMVGKVDEETALIALFGVDMEKMKTRLSAPEFAEMIRSAGGRPVP